MVYKKIGYFFVFKIIKIMGGFRKKKLGVGGEGVRDEYVCLGGLGEVYF